MAEMREPEILIWELRARVADADERIRAVLDLCDREDDVRARVGDGSTPAVDTAAVRNALGIMPALRGEGDRG